WQAGNTAVFVTFDEDEGSQNNQVYTAVVAPSVKPGTHDGTRFDHYSLLRTAEDLLGLPAIGHAASATGMEQMFNLGMSQAPQGGWVGRYGGSGYDLAAWNNGSDTVAMPGASVGLLQGSRYRWASNTS